ncbi:hypothetical protein LWS67_22455, partial [Bacillus atrophaeus]|uniref:hypothetical protein n=1 Tax=Bacillus atrophaeus TaxID=1452 RepID=UPI001EFB4311
RNDQPLLDFIVGKLDDHEKDKLLRLLGVRQGDEVAAHGTRETRDDKVEQFEADATLQPGHHAVRLGQALGEKSPTQVFTVATEAYYAAQKAVE